MDDRILFEQVQKKTAAEIVAGQLKKQIESGEYEESGCLPSERQLMNRFGRSHRTVKQALEMLSSDGLIREDGKILQTVHTQTQTRTDAASPIDELLRPGNFRGLSIKDIVEYLQTVEPELMPLITGRRTWEDISSMERALELSMECADRSEWYFARVMDLHNAVAKATHNPLTAIVWDGVIHILQSGASEVKYDRSSLYSEHRRLIDAIRSGDADEAARRDRKCWELYETAFTGLLVYDARTGVRDSAAAQSRLNGGAQDAIYEQIRARIADGSYRTGEKLPPERELAVLFGTSRPTVRSALQRLSQERYITIRANRGAYVNDISTDELERQLDTLYKYDLVTKRDILETRRLSEMIAVRWAALRRNNRDVAEIRKILQESEACMDDRKAYIECGKAFTNRVAKASHNDVAYVVSRVTSIFLHDSYRDILPENMPEEHRRILSEHYAIFAAIEYAKPEQAVKAEQRHLETVTPIFK